MSDLRNGKRRVFYKDDSGQMQEYEPTELGEYIFMWLGALSLLAWGGWVIYTFCKIFFG